MDVWLKNEKYIFSADRRLLLDCRQRIIIQYMIQSAFTQMSNIINNQ